MIKCIVDTVFLYFHSGTLPLLIISMVGDYSPTFLMPDIWDIPPREA